MKLTTDAPPPPPYREGGQPIQYALRTAHRLGRKPRVDSRFVEDLRPVILAAASPRMTPTLEAILEYALGDRTTPPSVLELARFLGISTRTLAQHVRAEGLPETRKILTGCLVLRATNYLCHTEQTVESVASRLGVADVHTLRRIIRRYLGIAPRELLDPTQWKGVVQTFVRSL